MTALERIYPIGVFCLSESPSYSDVTIQLAMLLVPRYRSRYLFPLTNNLPDTSAGVYSFKEQTAAYLFRPILYQATILYSIRYRVR
jgi:hypothetical protein